LKVWSNQDFIFCLCLFIQTTLPSPVIFRMPENNFERGGKFAEKFAMLYNCTGEEQERANPYLL
jgi:hypothetical protein